LRIPEEVEEEVEEEEEEEEEVDDGDEEYEFEEWVIQAPNLRGLTIDSEYDYMRSVVGFVATSVLSSNQDSVQLLTVLARVSKLELVMPVSWFLSTIFLEQNDEKSTLLMYHFGHDEKSTDMVC
jgi:hypothetical protein